MLKRIEFCYKIKTWGFITDWIINAFANCAFNFNDAFAILGAYTTYIPIQYDSLIFGVFF